MKMAILAAGAEGIDYPDGEDLLIADDEANFAQVIVRVLTQPIFAERLSRNCCHKTSTIYQSPRSTALDGRVDSGVVPLLDVW